MKRIDIAVPVTALRDDELTETDRVLVMKAREATYRAYAPYSKFHVGAAILLDNGESSHTVKPVCGTNSSILRTLHLSRRKVQDYSNRRPRHDGERIG